MSNDECYHCYGKLNSEVRTAYAYPKNHGVLTFKKYGNQN